MDYSMANKDSEISPPRRGGRRVKVFIKKYSELCMLGVPGESSFTVKPEEPNFRQTLDSKSQKRFVEGFWVKLGERSGRRFYDFN
jgi:hypothetical protein